MTGVPEASRLPVGTPVPPAEGGGSLDVGDSSLHPNSTWLALYDSLLTPGASDTSGQHGGRQRTHPRKGPPTTTPPRPEETSCTPSRTQESKS